LNLTQLTPGRWFNPAWAPETAGAFAVIVGVSRYKHLPGGDGPTAPKTYGLSQLAVSALTAYSFYRWLSDQYRVTGCPVAHVWLLLAPTDAEIASVPGMADGLLDPTFNECENAIGQCRNEMQKLTDASGKNSRFFFFFSGHGLEKEQSNQILLLRDYLAPDAYNINRAISTNNLWKGMASLPVSRFYYFIDACRSDATELRDYDVQGTPILPVTLAYRSNPYLVSPIQYATTSGTTAWQPSTPAGGISFFGQALMEGLVATPEYKPAPPCDIMVYDLNRYVSKRVNEILSQHTGAQRQSVCMGGQAVDDIVSSVSTTPPPGLQSGPKNPLPPPSHVEMRSPINMPRGGIAHGIMDRMLSVSFVSVTENLLTKSDLHSVTDSEKMEAILQSVKIYSLTKQQWLDKKTACIIKKFARGQVQASDTPDKNRAYRLTISFANPLDNYWLQVTDQVRTTACVLPGDILQGNSYAHPVEFEIEIDLGPENKGDISTVRRFETLLSLTNHDWLGEAANLWSLYRLQDARAACEWFLASGNPRMAIDILDDKMASPLGATVATILLIRARKFLLQRQDLLGKFPYLQAGSDKWDWIGNLARYFPYLPDGTVFWNEVLWDGTSSQIPDRKIPATVAQNFQSLTSLNLPYTLEAHGYLTSQIEDAKQDSGIMAPPDLTQRVKKASRFLLPTGLFATFSGPATVIRPDLVLPLPPPSVI